MKLSDFTKILVGKILIGTEFNEDYETREEATANGYQFIPKGKIITDAYIGVTEGDRDPCVYMELEGEHEPVYAYDSEEIYVKDQN